MANSSAIQEQIEELKLAKVLDKMFTKLTHDGIVEYFGEQYLNQKSMNDERRGKLIRCRGNLSNEDMDELKRLTKKIQLTWWFNINDKNFTYDAILYAADFEDLIPE